MTTPASTDSDAGVSRVNVGSYDVLIGHGLLPSLPRRIAALKKAAKYVLLSDENVYPLFGSQLVRAFNELGLTVFPKVIPAGEASKNRGTKAEIEDWMLEPPRTCGRDTVVVTMGGGVITDLGGFIASTYMRGVPVVHIPTTLLAMVDAAIGGKTGVDTPAGKNLVGTFHQPLAVFVDPLVLRTLPAREFCNGMAEIIKAGAIASQELFMLLENQADAIMGLDMPLLTRVISESARIKAEVVKADEKEGDYRSVLNFGHTIGHAVEGWMQPRLLHGECVAIGMIAETTVARSMGFASTAAIRRLDNICRAYRLPVEVPAELSVSQLMQKMAVDKKNKDSMIKMVILTSIGKVKANPYTTAVPDALLHKILCPAASVLPTVARGRVLVPGSKSASNRVLLMAAMAQGTCRIRGLLHSEDTQVMLDSLRRLGVEFSWEDGEEVLVMHGSGGQLRVPSSDAPLYLENAGTAARFLTTLCCLVPAPVTLTGSKRMKERPISDLADALSGAGVSIEYLEAKGCLPIRVSSPGGLRGGAMALSAAVSSQFVSSVLLSAPYAREQVTLTLEGQVVSEPYIEMTVQLMRQFGIAVQRPHPQTFVVPLGVYRVPAEYTVEGDASSATYPLAIAAITGGSVTVCNVGGASLQGDAQFCGLLARMGCQVSQTDIETTVTGPPVRTRSTDGLSALDGSPTGLKALGEVDMSAMTDSFLTLSVLAAAASGTTRIVNIANQRVKECNRIRAMCELLALCGVRTRELDTGLEIHGASDLSQLHGALIDCHNDHRIAMSFAVLGCAVPGVILDQKGCVNKTYPEFWDHIERCIAVKLDSTVSVALERISSARLEADRQREALAALSLPAGGPRIVIIGMRGVGKTTLGMAAARHLGLRFVDMDAALEGELGMPIREWVQAHSWAEFRAAEVACLRRVLAAYSHDAVISCGGGIIETPEAVAVLQREPLTVEIQRHADDVVAYLTADSTRPSLGEHPGSVYERRRPFYRAASRFEFRIRRGDFDWPTIEKELVCFLAAVAGLRTVFTTVGNPAAVRAPLSPSESAGSAPPGVHASVSPSVAAAVTSMPRLPAHTLLWTVGGARRKPLSHARGTFFLSLSVGDVKELDWSQPHLLSGVDAVEFRADLLHSCTNTDHVIDQLLIVRRRVFPLPIIFTVRSASQGGRFPDDEGAIFDLLHAALRHGCQLVDMECSWSSEARRRLLSSKGHAEVIGSMHLTRSNGGSDSQLRALFDQCWHNGQCDIVKVVVTAYSPDDALRVSHVAREWSRESKHEAVIALAMGPQGKVSRVMNQVLCPVTSPSMPVPAAPGQMTVSEIQHTRAAIGIVAPRRFFLFGSPIARSPSPTMHNAGFRECLLPHSYDLFDTKDPEAVQRAISAPDFGGASVTMPLKERVAPLLSRLSPAATRIGAVNTIVREADGSLTGDNTDWIGIVRPLRAVLRPDQFLPIHGARRPVAVVVGAGGTARAAVFALQQLGFAGDRVVVWNRTVDRAVAIANELGCSADYEGLIRAIESSAVSVAVIVVTLPGSAEYSVPPILLASRPVLFDVCYFPKDTIWSAEALASGCPIVKGIDMIIAQGVAQFELWTGKALAAAMDAAARKLFAASE